MAATTTLTAASAANESPRTVRGEPDSAIGAALVTATVSGIGGGSSVRVVGFFLRAIGSLSDRHANLLTLCCEPDRETKTASEFEL